MGARLDKLMLASFTKYVPLHKNSPCRERLFFSEIISSTTSGIVGIIKPLIEDKSQVFKLKSPYNLIDLSSV